MSTIDLRKGSEEYLGRNASGTWVYSSGVEMEDNNPNLLELDNFDATPMFDVVS